MATFTTQHPAIHKFYTFLFGGIAYHIQCDRVRLDKDGTQHADCHYLNGAGPGSTGRLSVEIDSEGNSLEEMVE